MIAGKMKARKLALSSNWHAPCNPTGIGTGTARISQTIREFITMNTQISILQRNATAVIGAFAMTALFVIAATPVFPVA